ncbi:ABC transporter substrate-binding protein [Vulcanimicrobium alpinum]|uniref:ABC transporter substrate-binding protein n=1 Tax=Vulcanimicrobium alpinum TaxID=3016050 RepID=A0AAN1XVS0_UNVUL|nr:ABC transporter substrate-binding protein [Vulcanimicrobium alpinum]
MCALLLLALGGCAARGSAAHDPSTLVILEAGDAGSIEPLLTNQYYAFLYQNLIFDTLLGTGANYVPTPKLALRWESNPAGTVWTVHLRSGVRWSDGTPFSAADVVWTFDALIDPKTGSPYQGQYAFIKRVVAPDPRTVRFELSSPNATFVANALQSQWIMPAHVFAGIPHAQIRTTPFGEHPIGTGPYALVRWQHDQECLLRANPLWWGGTPRVRQIDVRVILDAQGATDAMLNGDADVDDGIGAEASERLRTDPGIVQVNIPDLYTRFMQINFHVRGLDDVTVRRAMLYGWDREGIARGLRHGTATVASSVIPAGLPPWHDDAVKPYPYDPARAAALLDRAGWARGADGVRAKNGVRLSFTVLMPQGPLDNDIAAEFQADMRQIGIAIAPRLIDYATFIQETNASKFDLAWTGWGGAPDPDQLTLLDSKQIPPTGNNYGYFRDPAVDRDVEAGLLTNDPVKRRRYYDDMQERNAQNIPVLFGNNENYLAAYRKRVHVAGPLMPGLYFYTNVTDWTLDP